MHMPSTTHFQPSARVLATAAKLVTAIVDGACVMNRQCYMYRLLLEYAALFGNATVPDQEPLKPLPRRG
jgi:hypothetical protein